MMPTPATTDPDSKHTEPRQHVSQPGSDGPSGTSARKGEAATPLQDMGKEDLVAMKNRVLYEQAVKGQQPGAQLMQDKLSGENKQETWGNEPDNIEPDKQN